MTEERAVLAGGCFWGMQDLIRRYEGVLPTRVGYSGGDVKNATYRNHGTHAEAIEIIFDPARISFRRLLEFFFQIHDPTTLNRQGNDRGTSYRSAIFYTSDEQKRVALDTIADVDASGLWPGKVVTEVAPAGDFWEAEPEHQDYLAAPALRLHLPFRAARLEAARAARGRRRVISLGLQSAENRRGEAPMTRSVAEKRAAFRALHQEGCFVLPNPWDVGSARLLQHLGFPALASTSSGYAWTTGRPDYGVTRDDVLAHLSSLCAAVDLPVNADFESGFASDPEGIATNVGLAIETGVAGLSIEDRSTSMSRRTSMRPPSPSSASALPGRPSTARARMSSSWPAPRGF